MSEEDIKKASPVEGTGITEVSSTDEKEGAIVEVGNLSDGIDREVEKRILRKFDLHIFPLLTFMYFCS